MNALLNHLKPFAYLLNFESMSKKDFIKKAHLFSKSNDLSRLNLLEMIQFTNAHREGDDVVLD